MLQEKKETKQQEEEFILPSFAYYSVMIHSVLHCNEQWTRKNGTITKIRWFAVNDNIYYFQVPPKWCPWRWSLSLLFLFIFFLLAVLLSTTTHYKKPSSQMMYTCFGFFFPFSKYKKKKEFHCRDKETTRLRIKKTKKMIWFHVWKNPFFVQELIPLLCHIRRNKHNNEPTI